MVLFAIFFLTLYLTRNDAIARTTIFTGFILYDFVRIAVIRHQEKLTWLSNKFLFFALIISVVLQIVIIYTPVGALFRIVPMPITSWIILISVVTIGYFLAIWITNIIVKKVKD